MDVKTIDMKKRTFKLFLVCLVAGLSMPAKAPKDTPPILKITYKNCKEMKESFSTEKISTENNLIVQYLIERLQELKNTYCLVKEILFDQKIHANAASNLIADQYATEFVIDGAQVSLPTKFRSRVDLLRAAKKIVSAEDLRQNESIIREPFAINDIKNNMLPLAQEWCFCIIQNEGLTWPIEQTMTFLQGKEMTIIFQGSEKKVKHNIDLAKNYQQILIKGTSASTQFIKMPRHPLNGISQLESPACRKIALALLGQDVVNLELVPRPAIKKPNILLWGILQKFYSDRSIEQMIYMMFHPKKQEANLIKSFSAKNFALAATSSNDTFQIYAEANKDNKKSAAHICLQKYPKIELSTDDLDSNGALKDNSNFAILLKEFQSFWRKRALLAQSISKIIMEKLPLVQESNRPYVFINSGFIKRNLANLNLANSNLVKVGLELEIQLEAESAYTFQFVQNLLTEIEREKDKYNYKSFLEELCQHPSSLIQYLPVNGAPHPILFNLRELLPSNGPEQAQASVKIEALIPLVQTGEQINPKIEERPHNIREANIPNASFAPVSANNIVPFNPLEHFALQLWQENQALRASELLRRQENQELRHQNQAQYRVLQDVLSQINAQALPQANPLPFDNTGQGQQIPRIKIENAGQNQAQNQVNTGDTVALTIKKEHDATQQ
jgi:hypothetical protein